MRVLIIMTKHLYPSHRAEPEIFPQGPAYVAGALKAAGHDVFGVNISYTETTLSQPQLLEREIRLAIEKYQPEMIAIGGLTADYYFVKHAMAFARKHAPHTPILLGGGMVESDKEFIVDDLRPDFAINGEAEAPVVDLLDALRTGSDLSEIKALIWWKNGEAVHNPLTAKAKTPITAPYPYYEPLGIEEFFRACTHRAAWHLSSFELWPRMLPVSAGRSCPYRCTFCWHSAGQVYRVREIPEVIEEIAYFYEKHRFNTLIIYDELFSVREQRVHDFCDAIAALKLPIHWTVALRVNDATEDMLRHMKASGCQLIGFGLESADDRVLTSMKKKITRAQIEKAFDLARKVNMGLQGCFIFGDPVETLETIEVTTNFIKRHHDLCLRPARVAPYPGAPLFDIALEKGLFESRRAYYDQIHTAREYNMTEMSDADFLGRTTQVFNLDAAIRERAFVDTDIYLLYVDKPYAEHELPRHHVLVNARCPFCNETNDYNFDICFAAGDNKPLLQFLQGQELVLCRSCCRLMAIAFIGAINLSLVKMPYGTTPTYAEVRQFLAPPAAETAGATEDAAAPA